MQETQGEVEPLQMKEEQEKHEPLQIKYEQEELEPQQMQENQDELEVICVKEELQESELPHIKDEQEELCINLEKKEFEPKQDTEMFIVNLAYKNKKNREQELSRDQISSEPQNQNQERSIHEKSGSSRGEELRQNKKCQEIRGHNENVDSPEK
ncbi:hypothetical protein ATANTOWER_005858 [Ataeniobius toweri]|uniref:Involucrin n=1 Tax=Ataeniobius toweri TaxID=208326 RepID=A0ABU7B595_9TELE|nr:hypothetical protein [Ataeniobius toweri]